MAEPLIKPVQAAFLKGTNVLVWTSAPSSSPAETLFCLRACVCVCVFFQVFQTEAIKLICSNNDATACTSKSTLCLEILKQPSIFCSLSLELLFLRGGASQSEQSRISERDIRSCFICRRTADRRLVMSCERHFISSPVNS